MGTPVDMGGIDLTVNSVSVGAATPGASGTSLSGSELTVLDGITAGTVTASKAVVVDSNKDIATLRNVTMSGTLTRSGATGTNIVALTDNLADALNVKEGSNSYLKFVTTDSSESIVLGKAMTGVSSSVTGALTARSGTATPAAASAVAALVFGSAGLGLYWGTGSPNTALTAAQGSLYIRTDGSSSSTRMYVNTDGSTAWTNVTTAA